MKGPGLRANLDVRRVWRCPRCGRVARSPGAVTAVRCGCADETWMQLQPPVKREPFRPPPRTPEEIAEDRADEVSEEELPAEVPQTESQKPETAIASVPETIVPSAGSVEMAPPSSETPADGGVQPPASAPNPEPDAFGEGIPAAE